MSGDLWCGGVINDFEPDYDDSGAWRECLVELGHPTPPPPPPPPIMDRPTMGDYWRGLRHFNDHPARAGALSYLRELTIEGLRAGSISNRDLLYEVRPAAVAVSVLSEREVAGNGAVVAAVIRSVADRHPARWALLIDVVGFWGGSLASLLAGRDDSGAEDCQTVLPFGSGLWTGHLWRPANILLALAPAEGARRFLAAGTDVTALRRGSTAELMPGFMPLSRVLVEHTLSDDGSARARVNLAGNAFAPDSVLAGLLGRDRDRGREPEPDVVDAIRRHDFAGGAVRWQAYRMPHKRSGSLRTSLGSLLEHGQQQFLDMLAVACDGATEDDAALIHTLIRLAGDDLRPEARRVALELLARVSGPEVVWSLELARVGSLDRLPSAIRASMAAGSAAPLAVAVREKPFRDRNAAVNAAAAELRQDSVLDSPLPWLGSGQANREA
ncbi:hypothetical protein ABH935_008772 [Catenulispora sp. GAS73]|uniref:hypothetical protein n=1 Tax=Catenulispora sp. GAS73 TaxID=3156269 RepID=UPI003514BA98